MLNKRAKSNKNKGSSIFEENNGEAMHCGRLSPPNQDQDNMIELPLFKNSPHPLLIPHIVENVFSHFFGTKVNQYVPEVRMCRLVCHRWNEVATKIYRKHSEELVFGEIYGPDSRKMRQFLSDMENSFDCPVKSYRFDPGFFVQKNEPLFRDFLYSCTQWISTLKLWFDNQSNLRFPKRCYPDLKLDSLEYLFFGCANYRGTCSTEKMELTYVLDALLSSATNLKKFCFSFPPKDIRSQKAIIKRFGDLITTKCPQTVKNLKLEMKLTDTQLVSLNNIGLVLDTLHCDFRGSVLSANVIHQILVQQRNSLQEMRLLDSEIKYSYEIKFPRFERLTVFEIQGGRIADFSYREHFPVLERLLLFGWENSQTSRSMLESLTPCDSLTSLELPYKIQDTSLVSLTMKCFPNLKKLEITPTHEGMEALAKIFAMLGQLEELEITFPFIIDVELNVDPVFTGLSLEDCEKISSEVEQIVMSGTAAAALQMVNFAELQKCPNISNLKKLKKLTILDHSSEIRLTDLTAFFGILKLENLQILEMGRFNISYDIFEKLKEKFQVCENYESSDDSSTFTDSSCSDLDMIDDLEMDASDNDNQD